MENWAHIARNAKTHGDFAGRATADQDAYFEFFAGPEPGRVAARVARVCDFIKLARALRGVRDLRSRIFDIPTAKETSRT